MALEKIRIRGFSEPDRDAVEKAVIARVQADPEIFMRKYLELPGSLDGRYICADLFKETFAEFSASKEARDRYNGPVHNAAAVLSSEAFRRSISDGAHPERDQAIFLTGIPGAGKTSTILSSGDLPESCRTVFEGQLANPETAMQKIRQALDARLKASIIVVHPRPETALDNTFTRFREHGRGASLSVMSQIQGDLPSGLRSIHDMFGEKVALIIRDVRDRTNPITLHGWRHLDVLESEGDRQTIRKRLEDRLEQHRATGLISDACYRQAGGRAVGHDGVAGPSGRRDTADGDRRGLSAGDRDGPVLNRTESYWSNVAASGPSEPGSKVDVPGAEKSSGPKFRR